MKANHPVLTKLGDNVCKSRETRWLTQEQRAEKADVDPAYISGIERAVCNCSVLSLIRVALALEAQPGTLLEGAV